MDSVAQISREQTLRRMMRLLAEAKQTAEKLDIPDVERMLEMAIIGVTVEWDGLDIKTVSDSKLEAFTRARERQGHEGRVRAAVRRLDDLPFDA